MIKKVVLLLVSVLLLPLAMIADLQLKRLERYATVSFEPWPNLLLTPLTHLIFAAVILVLIRWMRIEGRQKIYLGAVFFIVGIFFTFHWAIAIATQLRFFLFGWGEYGELTRMVGAFFAAIGIFSLLDWPKSESHFRNLNTR
ncbi:MAG: hypothetical protein Fur0022_39020 [Anaerolineales bacterium]